MTFNETSHPRQPVGSPDGGKFAAKPGGNEADTSVLDGHGNLPLDHVPEWGLEYDRGPRPITVGTVIEGVDEEGRHRVLELAAYGPTDPRYPRAKDRQWKDVANHEPVDDADIEQWRPVSAPATEAGRIETEYREALHHVGREFDRLNLMHNTIMADGGLDKEGLHYSATAYGPGDGHSGEGLTPRATLYGGNRDGSRGFAIRVHRDDNTGKAAVLIDGDAESNKARKALAHANEHAEQIMTWREEMWRAQAVNETARALLHEYKNLTGEWL